MYILQQYTALKVAIICRNNSMNCGKISQCQFCAPVLYMLSFMQS